MSLHAAEHLLKKLLEQLSQFSIDSPGETGSLSQCLQLVTVALQQLRQLPRPATGADPASRIHFHKDIQAAIEAKLLFYSKALDIERRIPRRSRPDQIYYYRRCYLQIERFFDSIPEYYHYYRSGATAFDSLYFLPGAHYQPSYRDPFSLLIDPATATPKGYEHASVLAYDELARYLDQRLWQLQKLPPLSPQTTGLQWQASKTALTELIYALIEVRAFGGTLTDIKPVADYLQVVFNVQLSNIYSTYEDIRLRKKNRTPFMDALKSALERRIDHDDLHAPSK